jgi:hypothetical protein
LFFKKDLNAGLLYEPQEKTANQRRPLMQLEPFVFQHEGVLTGIRSRGATEAIAQEVNQFALRPLAAEEFVTFTLDLCHNKIDRHFSRFPEAELEKVNAMVPGRPLMERHDLRGSLPRGTFFRSEMYRDDDRVSVRPDVYVLRTAENQDFILNIEGGVYRETSIGFSFRTPECSVCGEDLRRCDHVPGRSYGDELCHFVMHDVIDVIEGSIVPSGSQGTGFVRGEVAHERALPLPQALEQARRVFHQPIHLYSRKTWATE